MKTFRVLLVTLAAVLTTFGLRAQTLEEVEAKYNQAAEMMQARKMADAIAPFTEVIELGAAVEGAEDYVAQAKKFLPQCYLAKGGAEANAKNYDDAIASFSKGAELAQKYMNPALANKAKAAVYQVSQVAAAEAFNNKDFAKAAESFARLYETNPKDTKTALNLAMSYCEMKEYEKGIEIYKAIIAQGGADAETAKTKAAGYLTFEASQLLAGDGKTDEAFALLDQAQEFDPKNPDAAMVRLQTLNNMKNYDQVIALGSAAAELQTTPELKSNAYFLLAAAYQNKDNKAKAIENYRKVTAGTNAAAAKAQIAALSK